MKKIDHYREPDTELYFEYHCWESPASSDAQLWYHSHQKVKVLKCVNEEYGIYPQEERFEGGLVLVYTIQFPDGFIGDAFEDELLDSESEYCRPNPPKENMKAENTTTEHNRTIRLTEIPKVKGLACHLPEMLITINYFGEANGTKAVVLDNVVIPAIIKAINK